MSMLPLNSGSFPERDDINVLGLLKPAREVGGDLYDFFVRDEKLFFCIGDVSGKGVPSALVMSVAHALFFSTSSHESNPAYVMRIINETACRNNETNMFVTFFIGVLDLPTGRLRYCNAGHDAPIVIGKEDVKLLPVKANLPLGVIDDYQYEGQEACIEPGSSLFLYTDGLTEAMDKQHNQFGLQRAFDTLEHYCGMDNVTLEEMLQSVSVAVEEFVDGATQSDDLTLMAVHYTPGIENCLLHDSLALKNDLKHVPELNKFVESFTSSLEMDVSLKSKIKLAVEEAVVNVIDYAYPLDTVGDILVEAKSNGTTVTFVISDSGNPFDPTEAGKVDTTLSAEDRPIGGLGIFLVRELMDSINYEWINGKNVLTLKKKYKS
jgi:sigma-B regulation protein RsbU (phosphoserine phosphatase)